MTMSRLVSHIYIALTVLFTVYSQLILRWQVGNAGALPAPLTAKVMHILALLLNPWVISGLAATFIAGISWMMTLSQFQLSYAYPFVSLTYVLVMVGDAVFFSDALNSTRVLGTCVVLAGVIIIARGG
jgi:drug/metabolite transporter (DMT)-like permease